MDKMKRYVKALELAQELSKDIPGITRVTWSIDYYGKGEATERIVRLVNEMQEKNGNAFKA